MVEINDDANARQKIYLARTDEALRAAKIVIANFDKALGLPMGDDGEGRATAEAIFGETAMIEKGEGAEFWCDSGDSFCGSVIPETEFDDSISDTLCSRADLGFQGSEAGSGEAEICEAPLSEAEIYDRAQAAKLDPHAVEMMRILLPIYFQLVRSLLGSPLVSLYWPDKMVAALFIVVEMVFVFVLPALFLVELHAALFLVERNIELVFAR